MGVYITCSVKGGLYGCVVFSVNVGDIVGISAIFWRTTGFLLCVEPLVDRVCVRACVSLSRAAGLFLFTVFHRIYCVCVCVYSVEQPDCLFTVF